MKFRQKIIHIMETQVNSETVADKVLQCPDVFLDVILTIYIPTKLFMDLSIWSLEVVTCATDT